VGGITLAWAIGEGIIIARQVTKEHRPPMPGELLASSAFFALLALVAEYPPARVPATMLAFGLDIAAYLQAPYLTPQTKTANASPVTTKTGTAPAGTPA
jgi:hypothetical protein